MLTATTTSQYSSSQSTDSGSDLDSPRATSPALSTTPFSEDLSQSDLSSPGCPSRIPRPRNSFMIFRCIFSREHKSTGKRVRRPKGAVKDKSLSKRASEAWHQLSKDERKRYEELARQEAVAHKEKYPDYHFRPMKRGIARKRRIATVAQHSAVAHAPLATPNDQPVARAIVDTTKVTTQSQPPSRPLPPHDGLERCATAPGPLVYDGEYLPPPDLWDQVLNSALKPSLSSLEIVQLTASSTPSEEAACCDPRVFEPPPPEYCTPDEPFVIGHPETPGAFQYQQFTSPNLSGGFLPYSTLGSSSLLGWDGETTTVGPPSCWPAPPAFMHLYTENSYFPPVSFDESPINPPVYNEPGEQIVLSEAQDLNSNLAAGPVTLTPTVYHPHNNLADDDHGMGWTCFDQNRLATEWPIFSCDVYPETSFACLAS